MPNILDSSGNVPLDYDEPPLDRAPVGKAWAEAKLAEIVEANAEIYYADKRAMLADEFDIEPVAITIPSTLSPGVAGGFYELALSCTGTGPFVWEQIGDSVSTEQIATRASDGTLVWRVAALPQAATTLSLKFRVRGRGGLFLDEVTRTLTVVAAASATVIVSDTLADVLVDADAFVPLDISGTPPFRVRVLAGGPLPSGVSMVSGDVTREQLLISCTVGQAQLGSEGPGVSTTLEVTGQGGVATKVFASGIVVTRKPEILNAGVIQIQPGSSGSYQIDTFGYPAPTLAKDAAETWPSGIGISSGGLISWTDQAANANTTTANLLVTATNSVGVDTSTIKFQIMAASASNAPPVTMTYWGDANAGVSVTGALIDSWEQQAGAVTFTGSGATRPVFNAADGGTIDFTGGAAPTTLTTAGDGALSLPLYLCFYWWPASNNPANTYRVFYDGNAEPSITYNENGSSQHRILYSENDVTVYGDNIINRGAWNKTQVWVNADGSWGQRINGVEKTGGAGAVTTPVAWSGLRINGTASTTGFTWRLRRWAAKSGSVPNATERAQMDDWLDNAWNSSGAGGNPPPPALDIPNVLTDSRVLGGFLPALVGASDATWANGVFGNIEWHSPRENGLTWLTGQRTYWEGNATGIPHDGLVVTKAGYKSLEIINSAVRTGKKSVRHQVNNTVPPYTGNGAAGRSRMRVMSRYRVRTSASATPPTPMIACWGQVYDDDMINNTDVRQSVCEFGHTSTAVPAIANKPPPGAPSVVIGKEDPGAIGRLMVYCSYGGAALNANTVLWSENKDILTANNDAQTRPQAGVPYYWVARWLLSYLSEGYLEVWMRSPAHFGGVATKVYARIGPNYYNDSYGESPAIGPQIYHWDSVWTPPRLSHRIETFNFMAFRDVAGTPTLTPAVLFEWMDVQG